MAQVPRLAMMSLSSWPIKPSPESILGGMMSVIVILVIIYGLTGCVSIKTHEKESGEAYVRGLERARSIAVSQDCINAAWIISGQIEVEEMKRIH